MAKINWNRHSVKSRLERDHWKDPKFGFDSKWHEKRRGSRQINLGIHEEHDWEVVKMETGPHAAKVVCKTCKNKFVTWLPKGSV